MAHRFGDRVPFRTFLFHPDFAGPPPKDRGGHSPPHHFSRFGGYRFFHHLYWPRESWHCPKERRHHRFRRTDHPDRAHRFGGFFRHDLFGNKKGQRRDDPRYFDRNVDRAPYGKCPMAKGIILVRYQALADRLQNGSGWRGQMEFHERDFQFDVHALV